MMLLIILLALLPARDSFLPLAIVSFFPSSPTTEYRTSFFAAASAPDLDELSTDSEVPRDYNTAAGELQGQEEPSGSMETKEHGEAPQAIVEEEGSEGIERNMEKTAKDATLNIKGTMKPGRGQPQGGDQQARRREERGDFSEEAADDEAHAQGQDAWETHQGEEEKTEENLRHGGGSDEQEEEGPKEGSSESLVTQDGSSAETLAGERQLETGSYVGGAVQQSEDDRDEGALPAQTTEQTALSSESGRDETVTDQEEIPQQQQDDQQRISSKNEDEETAKSTADLPQEEQIKTTLEQSSEHEQSKQEEGRQQEEDARQESEATNTHLEGPVRQEVNQEMQDKQEQMEDTGREWTMLETKEEQAEGTENRMSAAQQPQSEEATSDKEEEAGEATLREATEEQAEEGRSNTLGAQKQRSQGEATPEKEEEAKEATPREAKEEEAKEATPREAKEEQAEERGSHMLVAQQPHSGGEATPNEEEEAGEATLGEAEDEAEGRGSHMLVAQQPQSGGEATPDKEEEAGEATLGESEDEAEGRGSHMLTAQQPQSGGEATPDKEEEAGEATLGEAREEQAEERRSDTLAAQKPWSQGEATPEKEEAKEATPREAKEEQAEGRGSHMLVAQQPQSGGEATPDEEEEAREATPREAKEEQAEGRGSHMLVAQQPQSGGEATPDEEEEARKATLGEAKEEQAEGRGSHMLTAQQPQSEGEATPEKEEEEAGDASLREAKVDEVQSGKEEAASQREESDNTREDAPAEHKEGEGEQAVKEAPPGREQTRKEKKSDGVLRQHQRDAGGQRQHRADGVMQEFRKLISSLDLLAKRFEDQRTQLKQKHIAGQMEKQEQLLNENEVLLGHLLKRQQKLLMRWKEHWERMLDGGNRHAGFMRGAAVRAGPSREQVVQHQRTEGLTYAFSEAAKRFGETIRQVNECCNTFVKDHERALQVIYEYRRAIDLLEMGVRMNKLSKKQVHERLRACSEAFSVLSQLLTTFDKRVTSLLGLTGALEATQALSLAHLKQVIEAQEQKQAEVAAVDETTGVVVLKGKTEGVTRPEEGKMTSQDKKGSTEVARKKHQPRADPRLIALKNEQKQLLHMARRAVRSLERLSRSVAETTRSVVNARSMWMQELSTQLLRHFDFLLRAGKQLRLREQQRRQRRKSREKGQRTGGRHERETPSKSGEVHARTRDDERTQRKRRWESPKLAETSIRPRRKRQKLPEEDGAYDHMEDKEEEDREGHLGSESYLALQRLPDGTQRRGTPLISNKVVDAFRRQAKQFAGQGVGRGETQLLDDVNLAGWKAIQEMAEGARATSQIARDTREALEKEIRTDPTTVALGALLGIVLLFLLALVIYGYHMVFSYEEQINVYKVGNRAGQAIEQDEAKVTAEKNRSVVGNIGRRFG